MYPSATPHHSTPDVRARFENAARNKKFICPECRAPFGGTYRLWDHVKISHKDTVGDWDSQEGENVKKEAFLQRVQSGRGEDLNAKPGPESVRETFKSEDVKQKSPDGLAELERASSNPLKRDRGPPSEVPENRPLRAVESFPAKLPKSTDMEFRREVDESRRSSTQPQLFNPDQDSPIGIASPKGKQKASGPAGRQARGGRPRRQLSADLDHRTEDRNPSRQWPRQQPTILTRKDASEAMDTMERKESPPPVMLREPQTGYISHEMLVVELKGLYAGLVLIESKCIDVDQKQSALALQTGPNREPLKASQWQSFILLHKQLLNEHYDFFLASHHPAASDNLKKLAEKYSMPARLWRHAIHPFLEVLRHRLPEALEFMTAFIQIAYSMMTLLYETVTAFEDTWVECLGDLGRYRMAIEDEEPRDREVWSGVAKYWYLKASYKNPTIGRLYHHIAILARPFSLEQLSFYTRSLTCVVPFESAKGSIMTLFGPLINSQAKIHRSPEIETAVVRVHGLLFTFTSAAETESALGLLTADKGKMIHQAILDFGVRFKRVGVHLAVSNIATLFELGALTKAGASRSRLRRAFQGQHEYKGEHKFQGQHELAQLTEEEMAVSRQVCAYAAQLTFSCFSVALTTRHAQHKETLSMIHVMFVFVHALVCLPDLPDDIAAWPIPWQEMCDYLNTQRLPDEDKGRAADLDAFPLPTENATRPPPEHYTIAGQVYTRGFFPPAHFAVQVDDEEKMMETASHDSYRLLMVHWLARKISRCEKGLRFDAASDEFLVLDAEPRKDLLDSESFVTVYTPSVQQLPIVDIENLEVTPKLSLEERNVHEEGRDDILMSDAPPHAQSAVQPLDRKDVSTTPHHDISANKPLLHTDTILSDATTATATTANTSLTDEFGFFRSGSSVIAGPRGTGARGGNRQDTDQTDLTEYSVQSTVQHQQLEDGPLTPKAVHVEEPPMMDVSSVQDGGVATGKVGGMPFLSTKMASSAPGLRPRASLLSSTTEKLIQSPSAQSARSTLVQPPEMGEVDIGGDIGGDGDGDDDRVSVGEAFEEREMMDLSPEREDVDVEAIGDVREVGEKSFALVGEG